MSIWYDKEGKEYASRGKTSWIKFYAEYLTDKLRKEIEAEQKLHYSGKSGRHTAEDVDYDKDNTVKEAIRACADSALQNDKMLEEKISDSTWNVSDLVKFKGAIELDSDAYTTAKLNAKNASLFDTLESPLRGMYWYYVKAKTMDGYTQDSSGNLVQSPYYMPWGILIDVPYPFDGENIEQSEQKEGNPNVIPSPVIDDGGSYTRLQRLELMTSPTSEKRRVFVRRLVRTPNALGNYGEPEWEEWKKADAELATKKYVDSKVSAEKTEVTNGLKAHKAAVKLDHPDKSVTTEKLADKSVTAAKIADRTVGWEQLSSDVYNYIDNIDKRITGVATEVYEASEKYTDDALVNAKSYADQKLAAAKSYTDDKLTAVYKTIGLMKPDTWTEVQQIVEAGYGAAAFPVGTQFMTKHADTSLADSQTGYIYWDVVAHQNIITSSGETKPGMILISHYALAKYLYDAAEKTLDLPNGLAAGTYWFGVPDNYEPEYHDVLNGNESLCRTITMTKSNGTEVSQTVIPIMFTLSQAVPEGGYLRFVWKYATKISAAKIATYNSDSAVIESDVSISAGADGTYLGATGITATAGGFNQIERLRYGSNNWKESNMRKYLNSTASDGWYTPSTEYDLNGINKQGFIYGLSSAGENEFLSVVKPVQRITVTNNVYEENDSIASSYTTCDKFWIPSQTEITGTNGGAINENTLFEYFQNGNGQIKYINAGNNTAGVRAGSWRLRTPAVTAGGSSQCIFPSLGMMTGNAASVYFVPCCAIY